MSIEEAQQNQLEGDTRGLNIASTYCWTSVQAKTVCQVAL